MIKPVVFGPTVICSARLKKKAGARALPKLARVAGCIFECPAVTRCGHFVGWDPCATDSRKSCLEVRAGLDFCCNRRVALSALPPDCLRSQWLPIFARHAARAFDLFRFGPSAFDFRLDRQP